MLKSLDKKFLILAGLIISFPIVTIILLSVLQGCQRSNDSYKDYEKKMTQAAMKYFKTNNLIPTVEGRTSKVSLSTLVSKNLIKDASKALKDSSCSGNVTVRLNGSSLEKNEGGFLNYIANLKCKDYETPTILGLTKQNVVTEGSGLYYFNGEYIFKGDKVKNYIRFYDKDYRILGITNDGLARLVGSESESIMRMWDSKYNSEAKFAYGKTIYKDSLILGYLLDDYFNKKKINLEARKHLAAHDVCIGKRAKKDIRISKEIDCSDIIENQLISIMTISDYFLASNDEECDSIISRTCNNYNYLYHVASSTWTTNAVTDNTYEVFYVGGGNASVLNANEYNYYNVVIYIDANEKISSGSGTLEDPFIIN